MRSHALGNAVFAVDRRHAAGSPDYRSSRATRASLRPHPFMRPVGRVLFPYAVFGALLATSWNRWIQPYIDSGRELMVPWRLGHGESLYGQVHFHHGPLAAYLGAAVDRLAGPSLAARVGLAVLLALFHVEALRRLTLQFLPASRASFVTGLAVATAVFLRPGGWLFPFSFDTAIAVAGLTGALALLPGNDRRRDATVAGCLAAALLSRLEMGLVGVVAVAWETRRRPRRWGLLAVAPLALATVAYLLLSWGLPLERLIRDGWLALARPPAAFQNVYRAYAGLDRPVLRATELALAVVLLALVGSFVAAGAAIAAKIRDMRAAAALETLVVAVFAAIATVCLFPSRTLAPTLALFPPLVRVVPPAVITFAALTIGRRGRDRVQGNARPSDATLLVGAAFAFRLLLAAGYVGPYDAFFLPLPLTLASGLVLGGADRLSRSVGAALPRMAAAALAVFLAFRVASQVQSDRNPAWVSVSTPAGSLYLREPLATTTRLVLEDLSRRVPAGGTLIGFPEGGFFNYVLGRHSPTDREQFFPGHVETAEDEDRIIRRLTQSPPDAVLLCNVLAVGENKPAFGSDYLARLDRFLREDFAAAASYGPGGSPEARVGDPQFFVTIRVPRQPRPRPPQ